MEAVTYSLYGDSMESDQYYKDISVFTDEVIAKINEEKSIEEYNQFTLKNDMNPLETIVYNLEFLMIGILWNVYSEKAVVLNKSGVKIMEGLNNLKKRNNAIRSAADFFKGILNTMLLSKDTKTNIEINLEQFKNLVRWLKASGEFEHECKRIDGWLEFLKNKPALESKHVLLNAVQLADWFEKRSLAALGCYTCNVDKFIRDNKQKLKWKEDMIFCTRQRIEYHLNMVGAEIMNRAFRNSFLKAKDKRVLLPICMRLKQGNQCRALKTENGYLCQGCSKDCQVNIITTMGKEYNFKVFIIPHASSAFVKKTTDKNSIGIIGIACILNLISGGYKAKELGFEPQCVLLNYSGCAKHWHNPGIVTNIDIKRLKNILQITS